MDIVSHGLWGSIAVGRRSKRSFRLAFFFGIAPDLFSFGAFFVSALVGFTERPQFSSEPPDPSLIPSYVGYLYNFTHSFVVFAIAFLVLWAIFQRPIGEFFAWGLHILFDIPTHSYRFFPTPFLWPLSTFKIDGTSWASPWVFFPNIAVLALLYFWFFILRRRRSSVTIAA